MVRLPLTSRPAAREQWLSVPFGQCNTVRNLTIVTITFFVAQDIDIRRVWMAYIQLSLYGIPAMVIHGNTLTMEEWDRWYTLYALVPFSKAQSEDGDIAV